MSMSDDVAQAVVQISTTVAQKGVETGARLVDKTIDAIARLLQALAQMGAYKQRGSSGKENAKDSRVSSTNLTDIKPGEVSLAKLKENAKQNGDTLSFSEQGLTREDKKILAQKAKAFHIPIAFSGEKGKDNFYPSVRSQDLPIFKVICTEMMKDKLAERPQELGNFKVQNWEIPFITNELNKYDLSAQFGRTKGGELFCLYEKSAEKAIAIARQEFLSKCDEVKNSMSFEKDENGFFTLTDQKSKQEISFDTIPSREELSAQMQEKFGFDENTAGIACAKFGEEMLQGEDKKKFFADNPQDAFSKIDTNITLEGENILTKPYTCWRLTPKQDDIPRIVFQDAEGNFAVLSPEKMTGKQMSDVLRRTLNITDADVLNALTDKAERVTAEYAYAENTTLNYQFSKENFDMSDPNAVSGMRRTDEQGNVFVKKLPVSSIENQIERTGKDHFRISSTVLTVETDQHGTEHASPDRQERMLSFSDKKNAVHELTAMYKRQGVPEYIAVQMAKDAFRKAKAQSPEKVLQIEEIRAEKPAYADEAQTKTELKMTVRSGNRTEEIDITDREKAAAEISEKFDVGEETAAILMDKAAEHMDDAAPERIKVDRAWTDILNDDRKSVLSADSEFCVRAALQGNDVLYGICSHEDAFKYVSEDDFLKLNARWEQGDRILSRYIQLSATVEKSGNVTIDYNYCYDPFSQVGHHAGSIPLSGSEREIVLDSINAYLMESTGKSAADLINDASLEEFAERDMYKTYRQAFIAFDEEGDPLSFEEWKESEEFEEWMEHSRYPVNAQNGHEAHVPEIQDSKAALSDTESAEKISMNGNADLPLTNTPEMDVPDVPVRRGRH